MKNNESRKQQARYLPRAHSSNKVALALMLAYGTESYGLCVCVYVLSVLLSRGCTKQGSRGPWAGGDSGLNPKLAASISFALASCLFLHSPYNPPVVFGFRLLIYSGFTRLLQIFQASGLRPSGSCNRHESKSKSG